MSNVIMSDINSKLNETRNLLAYLPESIIMTLDSVLEVAMTNKREQIRKQHPYTITAPSNENGRWQTSYRQSNGKRINLKASTEEALLDKLIPLYFSESQVKKMTFNDLYKEWLNYKKTKVNSQNTIKRHEQHYAKYFESSKLHNCKVKDINDLLLEKECNSIIQKFNLSRKEWVNAKTILIGMFKYAVRMRYLTENPLDNIDFIKKFKQVIKKPAKTQVFNTDEVVDLFNYLDAKYNETENSATIAIKLNFYLGLRVGELVSLKWSDINDNFLHVVRQEVKDHYTNSRKIVEHTKGYSERIVELVPDALNLLQNIEHQGEYIFMRDGKRITPNQIAYLLRAFSKESGNIMKSSHKIRKTYVSRLAESNYSVDLIREEMGHKDLETTYGYIYSTQTEKYSSTLKKASLKYEMSTTVYKQ